ncbi:MAG: carboxypeptidase M32 [Fimbriimonadaceae bacterium]
MASSIGALKERLYDINALTSAVSIMSWDQQTYMPSGGAAARAEHLGILSRLAHEQFTADETGKLIDLSAASADGDDRAMLRRVKRDFELATKIPADLVAEKSRLATLAHEEWVHARANNDFKGFSPTLERMFEIARLEANYLGFKDHMYDALLDQYEEGATAADVRAMFETLKGPLSQLVRDIVAASPPDDSGLYGDWDTGKQRAFTEMLVKAIGFDMDRGRQDTAPHPFCTGWSVGDIRLTTRFKTYLGSAIFGSLHEAGHGMYEQGSPVDWDRTPLAGGVSLGLHESQSRLWENIVGRSQAFWSHFLPQLQAAFPAIGGYSIDSFYRAINKVQPSFIRVEADEVTYNLHVLVRFELECDLLTGALKISELPQAWNDKYEAYLGIRPSTDSEGCLQDVHWSGGMIGYFPTYSMGNLLSYQIWNTLKKDIPNVDELMSRGECAPILQWLQKKIYRMGRKVSPKELVLQVTGKPMGSEDYLQGLTSKYRELYALT